MGKEFLPKYFEKYKGSFEEIYALCKPATATSLERMQALFASIHYIIDNNVPGDLVECGVWRGGSSMMMAAVLAKRKIKDRRVWLYDTFQGMTNPTEHDVDYAGKKAVDSLEATRSYKETAGIWAYASFDLVAANLKKAGLSEDLVRMIKGPVERTIPSTIPQRIALLRLDTAWYESTLHEMVHLYPRLTKDGVLIVDDYGHWRGCRKAIDQYFSERNIDLDLHEIDYTGRAAVRSNPAQASGPLHSRSMGAKDGTSFGTGRGTAMRS